MSKARSKAPLFLMEVIIMLLVFSLSAAICLRVFAGAKKIAEESRNLDKGTMQAQKAAEYWKGTKGDLAEVATLLSAHETDGTITVYFDKDWAPVPENGVFTLEITEKNQQGLITILKGKETIFHISAEAVKYGE